MHNLHILNSTAWTFSGSRVFVSPVRAFDRMQTKLGQKYLVKDNATEQ